MQLIQSEPGIRQLKAEQPLPNAKPITLGADGKRAALMEAAEEARRKAWNAVYRWNKLKLYPYSLGREETWLQACEVDAAVVETWGLDKLEAGHAIKLLYICATPAQELDGAELMSVIEAAEAWGDEHVARHQTSAAIRLAKQIRKDAIIPQARLKATDRKGDSGNTAVPIWQGSYLVMLTAALQGSLTPWQMEWELSLARGRTLIHGRWIYDGAATLWLDKSASKTGAWMAEARKQLGL